MTLSTRGGARRRRRVVTRVALKWVLAFSVLGLASFYAYQIASRLAEIEIDRLHSEIATLTSSNVELDQRDASHERTLDAARERADQWQRAYERDIPNGEARMLYDAIMEKLNDGISRDRLAFIIAAANEQRDCESPLAAKRFIVTTPLQRVGPNNAVSFHNGAVVVTAAGASATDANGNAEAWFDPAQPVTVRIVALSGEEHEETGVLPLQSALVAGRVEHRLSVVAGPTRGFVQSALQTCSYP